MKKNENLNMDRSFREKLEGFSQPPPPRVWNNIQGQLAIVRKKRRLIYFYRIAAAAVIVMALLAGWYFSNTSEKIIPFATENRTPKTEKKISTENISTKKAEQQTKSAKNPAVTFQSKQQSQTNLIKQPDDRNLLAENKQQGTTQPEVTVSQPFERFSMKILNRIEAIFETASSPVLLAETTIKKPESSYQKIENIRVNNNVKKLKQTSKNATRWKMGMYFSPGYSSHQASHSKSYASNMTWSGNNGNGDIGGGVSVQYKTGKKWSVESGIYYTENGQKSSNSVNLFADKTDAAPVYGVANEKSYFNTSVRVASGQLAMNSIAGIIEFTTPPAKAEVATDFDSRLNSSNVLLTDGEFSQVFDFVEIPLFIRYLLFDARINVELLGGVSAGVVVGNNAFMNNNNGVQNIGKTRDISTLNFSGTLGFGVNYDLGEHISLTVEPRVNYYLNSINHNPNVVYRPYRIGVYTGVYYAF